MYDKISVDNRAFIVPNHWFWEEYKNTGWEPNTFKIFKTHITPNTHFIDIGAWLGVTSLYAIQCNCQHIHAVEANPQSFDLLDQTIKINNLQNQINIKNICIYNQNNKTIKFGIQTSSASRISDKGQYQVQTQTLASYLDEIIDNNHLDIFIKIDIEGTEAIIMDQIDEAIKNRSAKIFLSLHPPFWLNPINVNELMNYYLKDKQIVLASGQKIDLNTLSNMILSKDSYPTFGTKFGNFFEILIYK